MRAQQRTPKRESGVRSLHRQTTPPTYGEPTLSENAAHNDQNPTGPQSALILALAFAVVYTAGQLTTEQAQALIATGGIAELALLFLRLLHGRR